MPDPTVSPSSLIELDGTLVRRLGYGTMRFVAEYAREPDAYLGLLAYGLTMGQWLSVPMIVAGIAMMAWAYARAGKAHPTILDRMK